MFMISAILELCTCHVTKKDMEQLETEINFSAGNFEYGVFLNVPNEDVDLTGYSSSLEKVFALARERDCRFVLLDSGAPAYETGKLDTHEW